VRLWVIDTSSVIEIKYSVPKAVRRKCLAELTRRVEASSLFYPSQVIGELGRYTDPKSTTGDSLFHWAKRNEPTACRHGLLYDESRLVLRRIPNLIDQDKVSVGGVDEADPYVIALALELKRGFDVTIITDDVRTFPRKTALADAAGVFLIPSLTMRTFFFTEGIWDGKEGT
jgi:Domain of unknown function (DUF4411)